MNKVFKVIKIISDTSLLINAGENYKVKEGSRVQIYSVGNKILDPDTKEELGTLDIIKDELIVTVVYPKMCICEAKTTYSSPLVSAITANSLFGIREQKPLLIESTEISGGFDEDKKIRIGDFARFINNEE